MAGAKTKNRSKSNNGATVGYEQQLWQMADALRGSMDAAEYKHVVLGLIFLKYISDAFEEQHAKLEAERTQGADPEDPDEYRALSIFWVPPEARWSHLKAQAKQPTIGQLVDDAMSGIERDNPSLKGVLPKDYARPALDKQRLGQLLDLISNIDFRQPSPEPSPKGRGSEMQYRGGYDFSGLVERARELRKEQTRAEELLWQLLRNRQLCGAKFRRQHQFGDYLCDFYQDSITEHDRRHMRLRDYLASGAGDMREVGRSIRPHLEAFLRVAYPEHFPAGSMIGSFIKLCEERVGTAQEILDAQSIQELQDLNEYARRYHHQGWETEPINDGELRGFVDKTLRFNRR